MNKTNQLTQAEIDTLPPPPQEWIDDINKQKIAEIKKMLDEFDNMYLMDLIEKNKLDYQTNSEALNDSVEQMKQDLKSEGLSILKDYFNDDDYEKTKKYFKKNKKKKNHLLIFT